MTPARSRALAMVVTVAVAVATVVLTVVPLARQSLGHRERMEEAEATLARWRAIAATRAATEADLHAVRQQVAAYSGLFLGQTGAIASANMQSELKRRIEAAGGEVRSMQPSPATQEGMLERMEIKVDFVCPPFALPQLLANIENAQPFLLPWQVSIGAAEAQPGGQASIKLSHQWSVRGYRWAGGS